MMTRYTYLMGCLTIGMVLTSCIDEKDEFVTESQGNVVTQIAISVPGTPNTRMTVDATQADETFRGMKDITLIPFSAATYYEGESYPVGAGYRRLGTESYIPTTLGQGDIHAQNHSHLYFDVSLPLGTNAFLVYGRSAAETNGDLTAAGLNSATPSGISFTPVPFVENTDAWTVEGGKGYAIIAYLNSIFATQQDGIDWTNGTTYPVLNALFPMVKNMRAGSSASVLAFIQTIYDQLKGSATAAGVSEVIAAIKEGATYDSAGDASTALPESCQGFPAEELGLPDGAAVIEWNNGQFLAVTSKNNFNGLDVDVTNIAQPADLWYRANSRINTDTDTKVPYYNSEATWQGVLDAYTNERGSVMPSTRSVAIIDQLQYAVGRLDLRLEAKTTGDTPTTLDKLVDLEGTEFNVSDLEVTGVLIGQQSPVDFLFQSQWTDSESPSYTVYDSNVIAGAKVVNPETDVYTHTLALETAKNQRVNIAVELINNSEENIVTAIPGEEVVDGLAQMIPPGCKFYLVGTLDPAGKAPTDEVYSNYVFKQDYVTTVTFTVSDLTKAYYVIPNLNSVSLEFQLRPIDWKLSTPTSVLLK